jgi:hypothetical protein
MMIIAADLTGYFKEYDHFPQLSIQGHGSLPQRTWREELILLYPDDDKLAHRRFQCPLFMSNMNYLDSINSKKITNFVAIQLPYFLDKKDTPILFILVHVSQILPLTTHDITYSEWLKFYDIGTKNNSYLEHREVMVLTVDSVYFLSSKSFKIAVDSSESIDEFLKKTGIFSEQEAQFLERIQLVRGSIVYFVLITLILVWIIVPAKNIKHRNDIVQEI